MHTHSTHAHTHETHTHTHETHTHTHACISERLSDMDDDELDEYITKGVKPDKDDL
jgi:hypothetical protein